MVAVSALIVLLLSISTVLGVLQLQTSDTVGPNRADAQDIDFATFTIVASPSQASVGQEVTFFVNATSTIPNSTLTISIFFDAVIPPNINNTHSPYAVNVTGNPGNAVFKHTYTQPGNFTDAYNVSYLFVRAYVQDNESGTTFKRIRLDVNYNKAPAWIATPTNPLATKPGEINYLVIMIQDPDNDTLTIDWNFGDGTTAQDVVSSTKVSAIVNRSHSWNPVIIPSEEDYFVIYWMNVSVNDGWGHYLNYTSLVNVTISRNWAPLPDLEAFPEYAKVGNPTTFNASVKDREGDPITWFFDWGDGTGLTSYTPASTANVTVWNNQTHQFASLSSENNTKYNVTLYVTDVLPIHNISVKVPIFVMPNHAPGVAKNISYLPETLEINATIGYLNVTFNVGVDDRDGDPINATWNMDDGTGPRYNSTAGNSSGGTVTDTYYQWRNFTGPAHFNITVVVTDGKGHSVLRFLNATVVSTNRPPELTQAPAWTLRFGSEARPNETLNITMKVTDKEHDALTIVWDFGDNSTILVIRYNRTDYDAQGNITCNVSHSYSKVGEYKIRVWINDNQLGYGQHNVSVNASVTVKLAPVINKTVWDWWDYTSLIIFLLIPISFIIYGILVIHKRRKMDKEGIDWNEYRTKKEAGIEEEV